LSCTIEDPNNMRCLWQIYKPRVESPGKDVWSNNGLGWRLFQYLRVLAKANRSNYFYSFAIAGGSI